MNYRHIYHAGNFADVMKHLTLVLCLDYLRRKDKPFCVLDSHGGIGLYDLGAQEAQKTGEWKEGIGCFENLSNIPDDFRLYHSLAQDYLKTKIYPGSPLFCAHILRAEDKLIVNELHPDDVKTLKTNLKKFKTARAENRDAYEFLRGALPPQERRGLVLIDPPFEKTNEFDTLIRQMTQWKKRWKDGTYLLWYPIKSHLKIKELKAAGAALGLPETWCFECYKHPANQKETFNGSGLIIFNAPYQIPERLDALRPFLKTQMNLYETKLDRL